MFISLALIVTVLAAARGWLYDGSTPIDCIEGWGPWRCGYDQREYRTNVIYRYPSAGGVPCTRGEGAVDPNSTVVCTPTVNDKARILEESLLKMDTGRGARAGGLRGQEPTYRDILILLDMSGSISNEAFDQIKEDLVGFVGLICPRNELGSGRVNQLALVPFSDVLLEPHFDFDDNFDLYSVQEAIQSLEKRGDLTHTKAALQYLREEMFGRNGEERHGLRPDTESKKELILITDGQPTASSGSKDEVEYEARRLKAMGVEVFAFGIDEKHSIDFGHLREVASEYSYNHLFHEESFVEFTTVINTMSQQVEQHNVTCLPLDGANR
ncbi:hypothetical protein Bbelb_042670 [Branchiostoma belcheri]|nr:hypothetical protein Bbelb_042670 [Branchiostoma belcheri]